MTAETLRSLDARFRPSEDSGNYFIVVATRRPDLPSPSGHAFIVWGKEDSSAQLSSQVTFGFYPKDGIDAQTILGSDVPGDIVAESLESTNHQRISGRLIVQVNKEDFETAQARIAAWKTSDYNLYAKNCISFAKDVSSTIGLLGTDIPVDQIPANFFTAMIKGVATRFGGVWQSLDPAGRFRVEILGPRVTWIENSANGQRVVKVQTTVTSTSTEIRIERTNDDATLAFLGFSSASLRGQILATTPQPSFLTLRRNGSQLVGEWHGLLVKKRADGSLDSLVQPKDQPAKSFTFTQE
jgi:hypothetical protein